MFNIGECERSYKYIKCNSEIFSSSAAMSWISVSSHVILNFLIDKDTFQESENVYFPWLNNITDPNYNQTI